MIAGGNTALNQFRGPGYFDIDAQVTKNFTIKEKYKFGFGTQFYNILNHPNFANPSGSVTSSGLGLITSTVGPPGPVFFTFLVPSKSQVTVESLR